MDFEKSSSNLKMSSSILKKVHRICKKPCTKENKEKIKKVPKRKYNTIVRNSEVEGANLVDGSTNPLYHVVCEDVPLR